MLSNEKRTIAEEIILCLENVGIDSSIVEEVGNGNVFSIMDSLQYISFVAEIETCLKIELIEEFLVSSSFDSLNEFIVKLEYYVKGWESFRNKYTMKEGEIYEA